MIKRGLRRNILIGVSAIALSFMFVSTWGVSVHASEASREITVSEEGIDPHSEMIEWRYKVVDGVMYRRLYNYTEQHWVGEWEVCPW